MQQGHREQRVPVRGHRFRQLRERAQAQHAAEVGLGHLTRSSCCFDFLGTVPIRHGGERSTVRGIDRLTFPRGA
ncbi:hypothetical protein GCM10010428_76680 [Actinosynnema pretiosum subsp. pretiosum]